MKRATSKRRVRSGASSKPGNRNKRRADPAKKAGITKRLRAVLARFAPVELAKICGVTRQAVCQWKDFPGEYALAVEKASAGELKKEDLAPRFYPRPA